MEWYIVFMSAKGAYGSSSYKTLDEALIEYRKRCEATKDSKTTVVLCNKRDYEAIRNIGETIL